MKRLIFAALVGMAMLSTAAAQQDGLSQKGITGPPGPVTAKQATPPKVIKHPDPAPVRHPGKGITVLSAVVGIDGVPSDCKVVQSSGSKEADDNALAAIQKWRFKPATVDSHPVAVQITINMDARHP